MIYLENMTSKLLEDQDTEAFEMETDNESAGEEK